jgi:hypothetical protein
MASLPMPLHSMLRGHLRRANHDDGGDQYDDDDDGDDLYLTGSELGWNLSLSGLIIIGVIVFMFKFGIDPPVRADGISPGCCNACCAAGGCLVTGGRIFRQGLLASALSILGFMFWIVYVSTNYKFQVPIIVGTLGLLGIVLRGFYPGCCGDKCTGGGGCVGEGVCHNGCNSCNGASLMCCRILNAVVGWFFCACSTICCVYLGYPLFAWLFCVSCWCSSIFMFLARCFAYAVPLRFRNVDDQANAAAGVMPPNHGVVQGTVVNRSHSFLPLATVSYYTPEDAQRQTVHWGGSDSEPPPAGNTQVAVVINEPTGARGAASGMLANVVVQPSSSSSAAAAAADRGGGGVEMVEQKKKGPIMATRAIAPNDRGSGGGGRSSGTVITATKVIPPNDGGSGGGGGNT